jgi:hypothetical protein
MQGSVPDDVASQVIAYARTLGCTVSRVDLAEPLLESTWTDEELRSVDPLGEATIIHSYIRDRLQLASLGVRAAADLTQMTILEFLQPEYGLTRRNLGIKGEVLEFMIRHRICFSDFNPTATLRTCVHKTDMSFRASNALQRSGVKRVELLTFFTQADVSRIRNIGTRCLGEIRDELAKLNLAFKDD